MPQLFPELEQLKFIQSVRWNDYTGATFAFAAWRRDGLLCNLACRIVLRTRPPAPDWQFSDDVEELAIRRGWIPAEELRVGLGSLQDNQIVLGGEILGLTRDRGDAYGWTRLVSSGKGRKEIGWRSQSLFGLGENQFLFLGSEAISRVDARLRTAVRRPFNGWSNLAAFLGESEEPLELMDRFNTYLGCFAPVYARIEPESSLSPDGVLSICIRCMNTSADPPLRLLLASGGAAPPQALELSRVAVEDVWEATARLSPTVGAASLALMLGDDLADEVTLRTVKSTESAPPSILKVPAPAAVPPHDGVSTTSEAAAPPTLVDRWKRNAANHPLLAALILLVGIVIGIGSVITTFKEIVEMLPHHPAAAGDSIGSGPRPAQPGSVRSDSSSVAPRAGSDRDRAVARVPSNTSSPVAAAPYTILRLPTHGDHVLAFAPLGFDSLICEAGMHRASDSGNRWLLEGTSTPLIEVRRFATHLTAVDQVDDFVLIGQWVSSSKDTAIFVLPRNRMLDKDLRIALFVQVGNERRAVNARGSLAMKDQSGWEIRLKLDLKGRIQAGDWRWAVTHSPADLF